jgi:two-component system sensor histidine kinase ArlS
MGDVKISHKILLLFILQVTTIISLLAFSIYYFSSLERKTVFNNRLRSRAIYIAQFYSLLGDSSNSILRRVDSSSASGSLPQRKIAIYTIEGRVIFPFDELDSVHIHLNKEILAEARTKEEIYFKVGNLDAIAVLHKGNNKEFVVAVAAYDLEGLESLDKLIRILLFSLLAAIILTASIGLLFSRKLLRPITQIIDEVNDISSNNLSHRLKGGNGRDELGQLANTFNDLLGRLQKSFNVQRRFIANASHELSTPLTSISSQLEVTLQKERNISEYQNVLLSINEDVLKMRQLTISLLEIAKADSQGNIGLAEVRLDEILLRLKSEIKKIDSNYKVELYFGEFPEDEKDCVVFGNMELLHSAIKNIIENGCKYSPDKLSRVDISYSNHHIYIHVSNTGNIIPEEEMQKIFQPFFRGANVTEQKGSGLGLALAQGIARLHKGSIEVKSDLSNGTIFTIDIPSYKSIQMSV